jgi:hypothetical protein
MTPSPCLHGVCWTSNSPPEQRNGSWDRLNNMLPPSDASRVASIIEKVLAALECLTILSCVKQESLLSRAVGGGGGGLAVFGGSSQVISCIFAPFSMLICCSCKRRQLVWVCGEMRCGESEQVESLELRRDHRCRQLRLR